MGQNEINMLKETLEICQSGLYRTPLFTERLQLDDQAQCQVYYYSPEALQAIRDHPDTDRENKNRKTIHSCENTDSFSMAGKVMDGTSSLPEGENPRVLVLNFANAFHPGGGVRYGAMAQEEDLCRKSSLLRSLESREAEPYYQYHRALGSRLSSDAILLSPNVEIIRDINGQLLPETQVVSVMTCAAPDLNGGLEGLTGQQYEALFYHRIQSMLYCAAYNHYEYLVLGAFGCGAFGNDARLVSDLFAKALREFSWGGRTEKDFFCRVDFAVLSRRDPYNFREFYRNFGGEDFPHRESVEASEIRRKKEAYLDRIKGSLVGGAAGDALGFPVEFMGRSDICRRYGPDGITGYQRSPKTGKALISDDTQMTLFTANGILVGETQACLRGIGGLPSAYVPMSYQDWFTTQTEPYQAGRNTKRYNGNGGLSWLLDVPDLYNRRAPGRTCMQALADKRSGGYDFDFLSRPVNESKGCGGIMRIAPLGLHYEYGDPDVLIREGAMLTAITHGHPLGYLPAAMMTDLLNRIVYHGDSYSGLYEITENTKAAVSRIFRGNPFLPALIEKVDLALKLSRNRESDPDNIRLIGQGWVAEETLAIALYCALRHEHDFSAGIQAAVNITGDSDSTGAVTGNLLGAINGYQAIDEKWKENLELRDVIEEMAEDLCCGCQMTEGSSYQDPDWIRKYIDMHWLTGQASTFFSGENEENGYLSNGYPCSFVVGDFCYLHMEQYFMARKAKLFHDARVYTAILRADTPDECRTLGSHVENFEEEVWQEHRMEILKIGLRAKFTQNAPLLQKLLATGQRVLAKTGEKDGVYGIGLSAAQACNVDQSRWPGENLLGKALMEIREELK